MVIILNRLAELRKEKNLSMKETAVRLHLPYTTYVSYEKGDREPNSEVLIKLADFYNTTVDFILGVSKSTQNNDLKLSNHEKKLVVSYREHPEMQLSVDRLLGIEEEKVHIIPIAARNGNNKPLKLTDSELETLKNLPDVPPEL